MEVQDILSNLIKIKSVNPPGGEMAAAQYLKQVLDREGVSSEIVESTPGRGNLIARAGKGRRKLLYLSHTDVVPVTEGWDFDPFSGEIKDGFVLGRGALDCKGLVAAEVYALIYVAKHFSPGGELIFAATADEEVGGTNGVRYILEKCPDKIKADFAVNEGGEEPLKIGDQVAYFTQIGEKGTAWAKLSSRGLSCHGSVPTLGDNAVTKMARAVSNLAEYKPEIRLIPEVKSFIQALVKAEGRYWEINEKSVDEVIDTFADKAFREYLRAITRMTVSPNFIHGGVKTNIVPDSCEADVDIRVLPGQDKEYVVRELKKNMGEDIAIEIADFNPVSFSPADSRYYFLIQDTLKETFGETICLPCISSGATDSRFLRKFGIPSYGLSLMAQDYDPALKQTVHGKNERIDLKSLTVTTEFLIRLAKNYLVD